MAVIFQRIHWTKLLQLADIPGRGLDYDFPQYVFTIRNIHFLTLAYKDRLNKKGEIPFHYRIFLKKHLIILEFKTKKLHYLTASSESRGLYNLNDGSNVV